MTTIIEVLTANHMTGSKSSLGFFGTIEKAIDAMTTHNGGVTPEKMPAVTFMGCTEDNTYESKGEGHYVRYALVNHEVK